MIVNFQEYLSRVPTDHLERMYEEWHRKNAGTRKGLNKGDTMAERLAEEEIMIIDELNKRYIKEEE